MDNLEEKLNREYKLMAFDLDGTLLDNLKKIPEAVKDSIMEAYDAGKILVFSTGRNIAELADFRNVGAFRYAIAINGSYIYDLKEDKAMVTNPIPKENVEKLFVFLKIKDIHLGVHSEDYYLDKEILDNPERHHIELLVKTLTTHGIQIPSVYDLYYSKDMNIYKVNIYLNSNEERDEIRKELSQFDDDFEMVYSEGYSLELSKKGVSKGKGLHYLCDYLGIDIKDTIAIGDNENDLEAIKAAGLGIAMENATAKVKEVADAVVPTNEEYGCKTAIEKYLLKKK